MESWSRQVDLGSASLHFFQSCPVFLGHSLFLCCFGDWASPPSPRLLQSWAPPAEGVRYQVQEPGSPIPLGLWGSLASWGLFTSSPSRGLQGFHTFSHPCPLNLRAPRKQVFTKDLLSQSKQHLRQYPSAHSLFPPGPTPCPTGSACLCVWLSVEEEPGQGAEFCAGIPPARPAHPHRGWAPGPDRSGAEDATSQCQASLTPSAPSLSLPRARQVG